MSIINFALKINCLINDFACFNIKMRQNKESGNQQVYTKQQETTGHNDFK